MDNNRVITYNSQTYNAIKAFSYGFPAYIIAILIITFGFMPLHMPMLSVIAFIMISTVPFLFQKSFKNLFTRRIALEFTDMFLSIKEYNTRDILTKEYFFNWPDMKSYKCYFSATNITFLTIYLKNGSSKTFPFKDQKDQKQAMNEKSVFSIFYYFICTYNLNKQPVEQINFNKGFLTTRIGTYILFLLGAFEIIAIILGVVFQSRSSLYLVPMSVFIILGLIIKRASDNTFYNKIISKLDARSPW